MKEEHIFHNEKIERRFKELESAFLQLAWDAFRLEKSHIREPTQHIGIMQKAMIMAGLALQPGVTWDEYEKLIKK